MKSSEFRYIFSGKQSAYALQVGRKEQAEFGRKLEIGDYYPIRKPITVKVYDKHFNKEITAGIYVVDENDKCSFTAIDLDDKNIDYLNSILSACNQIGLTENNLLIEFSGSKGYHVFIPFQRRILAKKARALGLIIKELSKIGSLVEVFPKQTTTNKKKGFGNLIKLPLGKHKVSRKSSYFMDTSFNRVPVDKINVTKVTQEKVDQIIKQYSYILPDETTTKKTGESLLCIKEMSKGVKKGYRDNSAFTLAAYFKQNGDPIGQTKEDCTRHLLEWNKKNNPPMPHHIIIDKIESVYSGGYFVPGCNSDQLSPFCDHRCWKHQVIYGDKEEVNENELSIYDCIPSRGVIKDYIDYASERNASPIEYHLMTILSLLSVVVGDSIWFDLFDDGEKIPNIYILLIGGSGVGKGSAINIGTRILSKVSNGLLVPHDFLSREALIDSLVAYPSGLLILEEFSSLLAKSRMSRYAGILQLLTQIYDNPENYKTVSKGEGPKEIHKPQISILAATTPEWIAKDIKYEDISGGFLCRYLFINASTIPDFRGVKEKSVEHIKKGRRIEEFLSSVLAVENRAEADLSKVKDDINQFLYDNDLDLVNSSQEDVLRGYWNRLKMYIIKLAILYQISLNNSHVIEGEAFDLAYNLISYAKDQVKYILKNVLIIGDDYAVASRVAKLIKNAGRWGIKRGKLHRISGINNMRKFDGIIDTLEDQEIIFHRYLGGSKKKSNMQFYDGKYQKMFNNGAKDEH